MQSQCRRRRRWSIDKWPKNKMQKKRNQKSLEVIELLNDEKRRNKEETKGKKLQLRIVLYV